MIKILAITFNIIALISFNFLLEEVTLSQQVPERVEDAKEFIVTVTIDKSTIEGYAKFQVNLPEGATATAIESNIAKFNFEDNKAKFVWMTLPTERVFDISYKVVVTDPNLKEISIAGTFSYLDENQRMTSDLPPNVVKIGKEEVYVEVIPEPEVTVTRKFLMIEKNVYQVQTNIHYAHISGFAKIQDIIPANAIVKPENSSDAVFSTVNTKVKFVWMNFPEDRNDLSVSYILNLKNAESTKISDLTGEFAYIHDGESRKMNIINPDDVKLVPTTDPVIAEVPKEESKPQPKENIKPVENIPVTSTPSPEDGVIYKVQVMATHTTVNTTTYFTKNYSFNENVIIDQHQGWIKYITGSFDKYASARNKREDYRANFDFNGPFVVAYNNGQRITVQEALMITNQKWIN